MSDGTISISLAQDLQSTDWVVAIEQSYHGDFALINHLVYGYRIDPDKAIGQAGAHSHSISEVAPDLVLE